MEALAWLSRSSVFVSPALSAELIRTFRDTEMPLFSKDARKRYTVQITESLAVLTACHVVKNAVKPY